MPNQTTPESGKRFKTEPVHFSAINVYDRKLDIAETAEIFLSPPDLRGVVELKA